MSWTTLFSILYITILAVEFSWMIIGTVFFKYVSEVQLSWFSIFALTYMICSWVEIVFLPTLFLCRMSISPVFPSADRAVPTLPPLPPLSPEHSGRVAQPGGPVHHGWLLRLLRRGRRGPLLLLSLRLLRPPGSHVVLHHGRRPCADSGDHQGALLLLRIHGGGRCGIALTHSPRLPSHRGSGVSRLCGTHCSVHGECWWTCTC